MAQPEIPGNGVGIPGMPFGSDGDNWIALLVDALGRLQIDASVDNFPADPATQTTLALCLTALQKIDDLQNALGTVAQDLLRVESKGGDKIFGFGRVVEEQKIDPDLDAGLNDVNCETVGEGKIWELNHAEIEYSGTPPTRLRIYVIGLAGNIVLVNQTSPGSDVPYSWEGRLFMQYGDYLQGNVTGATATDNLYLRYTGVELNIP